MIRKNFKKAVSLLLALAMLCINLFSTGTLTAFAAVGEKSGVCIVEFPRSGEANRSGWGHEELQYMNGWHTGGASNKLLLRTMGSYTGQICYCIEPGTGQHTGDTFTQKDENFWNNFPPEYNKTIDSDSIKLFIGRIIQYGYTGNVSTEWRTQNPDDADKLSFAIATQLLIWETIVGERDYDFNHIDTGSCNRITQSVRENNPIRSQIMNHYARIEKSVQNHSKVPSNFAKSISKAQTVEMTWDGNSYVAVLQDKNNVLSEYSFHSDNPNVSFSVNENTLTVISQTAPTNDFTVTAEKKNAARKGLITWTDGIYKSGEGSQDTVAYTQSVSDPVKGYLNLKVSYGSAKIVKTSEDGKIDGVSFTITGNGIHQTVKTNSQGEIQVDNLTPGVYTVTEVVENKYEPQETRRVTVVSGQTATVTFSNVLKRGDLTVTKTSEDGLSESAKFHLFGTSLSGLAVDEYAVVGGDGKAYFKDVLIGSGYTLEEVDTAIRYVVPEKQTADIEWDKVTDKSFNNILKKWQLTVTKSDKVTGNPQGDASLAGAKYGIFKSNQLIDTYTTDANGQFTTKYYVCGDDWSLRELSASEGYLVSVGSEHIGAEPKLYTVEYNNTALDVLETVRKGKIALIKHCDDGSTQIETPETGAEFEVFLKSSGSYEVAKDSERDILICDKNGFAETKDLPYGIYTVKQTKGWAGRELMPAFDVFVNEDGEIYRYLINNAVFKSLIEIVKKDAETGEIIPASGIGFKVRNTDTGEYIVQHINYPTPVDIEIYYTDSTGKLMLPETLPYGNYEIIEQNTCYGYVLDSNPVSFKVDGSQTIVTVEKHNTPQKGVIEIAKEGEIFSSVTESNGIYTPVYKNENLAYAVFQIYAAEDIATLDGTVRYQQGELVDEITTGKDGIAKSKQLYLGKYTVIEKTAPDTFYNPNGQYDVELTYAGQDVKVISTALSVFNDRQKVSVSLLKELSQDERFKLGINGEILSVQFGVFASEDINAADGSIIPADGLITHGNCDENGKLTFNCDLPIGFKWYAKEMATDEHYILSDKKYEFATEYQGQDTKAININLNNSEPIINEFIYGTIKGLKTDRETKEPIKGALFGLFRADETEFTAEKAILTAQSDENGIFAFENVPYGNFFICELKPADGYLENTDIHHIQIGENEQIIEITAVNDKIPEIGTKADVDGEKKICATEVFTLTDTVSYKHLIPGKEYVLKGVLMDKTTGKPLIIDGEEIRSETAFTPENSSGEVTVKFTFDSKFIKQNTDIVVFENLYREGKELAVHADIEDEGQTVTMEVPEIGTKATVEGKKEITADGEITIDDVVSYKNLTPGKKYVIKGVLMDKSTGKPFEIDGKTVTSEVTFTPEKSSGEVKVSFNFDASGIKTNTELVVFETLYREGVEIAAHADIDDKGQTVTVIPPAPPVPQTGDESNLGFWIGLGAIALGGLISVAVIYLKKKKDDDNE